MAGCTGAERRHGCTGPFPVRGTLKPERTRVIYPLLQAVTNHFFVSDACGFTTA